MTVFGQASLAEIEQMLDWAAAEGWNPGIDDAAAFQNADPMGFFVARSDGKAVGCISVVNHSDQFAFLGLYIVRPEFRGQGIGKALWDYAIEHSAGRTIGLDGVPDQQANYARSGFLMVGATERFTGVITGEASRQARRVHDDDIPGLIEQEARHSGTLKPAFLGTWYATSPNRETWLIDGEKGPIGHATIRKCRAGSKLGPLCANEVSIARELILHCASRAHGPLSIDVPKPDSALRGLCLSLGMTPSFETARMYKGEAPPPTMALFAVSTLELG